MDDDETRKMILRLQMENLASIWTTSTTSTIDDAELDADVSLRLYRQELRAAEQQIDDERSAQAVAQDELRQRDALLADREAARRLFLELNPDEPLPDSIEDGQLALTTSTTSGNVPFSTEVSPTSGSCQSPVQPVPQSSSSPFFRRTALSSAGVKRSASHLDTADESPSQKQASDCTDPAVGLFRAPSGFLSQHALPVSTHCTPTPPGGSVQVPSYPPSASMQHKRPAQNDHDISPPANRHKSSSESFPPVFGTTQPVRKITWTSPVPDTAALTRTSDSFIFASFGMPTQDVTAVPDFGQSAELNHGSTPKFSFPSEYDGRDNRTASTADSDTQGPQKLPASRQPVAPGHKPIIEQTRSLKVECVACCKEVSRSKTYSNSCSHVYCSKCITRLCRKAVRDDSLWPPQCCNAEMPIKDIEHLLREDLIPSVKARQVEMSVPIPERTYCVDCSTFIPQEKISERSAFCHQCLTSTCSDCKEKTHVGDC
jgi:hypothetical protein